MERKRVISSDPAAGKQTTMEFDRDGKATIVQQQNVDHIIEANKKKANEWQYGKLIGNTQRHHQQVAEIPNQLYMQLREKFGHPADNPKEWARWLNDPNNRFFRTGGGRI